MRTHRVAAFAALLGLLALVLTVRPAAAGTSDGVWALQLAPITVTIDGTKYRFRILVRTGRPCEDGCKRATVQVIGTSRYQSLTASAVQKNLFSFFFYGASVPKVVWITGLRTATVHADSDTGGRLRLHLKFAADHPVTSTCDGHTRSRTGTITGTLRFRPVHSRIGTITKLSRRAKLTHADGTCGFEPYQDPTFVRMRPCEPGTVFVIGEAAPPTSRLNFIARRDPDSDMATIDVAAREASNPNTWYTIQANVPADHVTVPPDLSSATLRGARGAALTGTATSVAEDPTDDQPVPWPLPFDCESVGAGATVKHSLGPFHGDLSPQFWAGGYRGTDAITVDSSVYMIGAAP